MPVAIELDGLPHHWQQGPGDVHRVPYRKWAWKFRWYLDATGSLKRKQALTMMYMVLNHPLSWERTGVQFVRTMFKWRADILVRFGPANLSACGPGSAGCYWWDENEQKPVAYMGEEYVHDPSFLAELINMELGGHGCFKMWDSYTPSHQPYPGGVMGTWEDARKTSYFPSDLEIEAAKAWLRGQAVHVHWHQPGE